MEYSSEISKTDTKAPPFRPLSVEDVASEEYQEALKSLYDYAEDVGFKQEIYFLYCVKKGRVRELETELDDLKFTKTMNTLFENNRALAYKSFTFLLPQIHSAAVDGGVSMKSASLLYEEFFERADGADVTELLELNREAFIVFATRVADVSKNQSASAQG